MSYSILSDQEIAALCRSNPPMLDPFVETQ